MIYFLLFFLSLTLTYIVKNYALKNALMAEVNERSSHTVPTPQGGGIAIAVTWFVGLIYLYSCSEIESSLFYALISGLFISLVGYLDDLYGLRARTRLLAQAFVAFLGLYFIGGFQELSFSIFTIQNQLFTNIFAFLMIIWFINLYNFLDGIDGYAGSEAIFLGVAGFLFFGGAHFLVLVVCVLGFLVWNWDRAKIFMGDVGSTLLGYNVAIFTIYYANQDVQNFWIWIVLFELFWVDATLTLLRRVRNGEKIYHAHKKHFYQRLNQSGWSHSKVVLCSISINIVLFLMIFYISNIFITFLVSLMFLYAIIKFIDKRKSFFSEV